MKKIIAIVVAIAAGALVFSKVRSSRSEQDLWHEATTSELTARRPRLGRALARPALGDVAQLAEHRLCKAGVRGSIPLVSTTLTSGNSRISRS